ncbi:class A beta-lactamase-related serine hydrolase [Streptomyces carpaticus]|uniref:serine hydrolase n=1 Tax=Streptomyces TaxID=1883 RepID=UPI0021FC1FBE|nr:class A beta-lactamase-related serine hydrolase [Streptomyces carpaticus]
MNDERLLRELRDLLRDGGLRGSFLVRDLATGEELGIDPDRELPVASLVKIPLAIATLERVRRGELDATRQIEVAPGRVTSPGPTGLSRFRHPARMAVEDLLYLGLSISDSTAADALFALTPPAEVARILGELGLEGIKVRHPMGDLEDTPVERLGPQQARLAQELVIAAAGSGPGHPVPQLDLARANTGTARAFTDLLQALWTPSAIDPVSAARIRELMGANLLRQRLAPDFSSDAALWSSKTGTLLHLRHESGVVEHADGQVFAVTALTESRVAAGRQPEAEALMGRVARALRDQLRQG